MPNYIEKSAYCPTCGEQRLVTRKGVSGGMTFVHAVLSVITLGIWLIFWRGHAEARELGGYRCTQCGTKIHKLDAGPSAAAQLASGAEPLPLDAIIKRDLDLAAKTFVRKSVRIAPTVLADGERPLAAAAGLSSGGSNQLWLVTNSRVLRIEGEKATEIEGVTAATGKAGFVNGKVVVSCAEGEVELKSITPENTAETFAAAIGARADAERAAEATSPSAGWYPDPTDTEGGLRYWDGRAWTNHSHVPTPSVAQTSVGPPTSDDDTRPCPDCAELIKKQARVCRFCGYRFNGADARTSGTDTSGT